MHDGTRVETRDRGRRKSAVRVIAGRPMSGAPTCLRRLTYPAVMVAACAAFGLMAASEVPLVMAVYLPVLAAGAIIIASEWRWPYRRSWWPNRSVLLADATYTVAVQMALPAVLSVGFVLIVDGLADESGRQLSFVWPHSFPGAVQVILILMIADLFRYPLHRVMHQSSTLWRFHAVHHSPDRLYFLNVSRFHPFEKALQGLLDVLPFVIVGVDDRVLAGYLVFYAVNGLFQHSNCDVELGPLNYLISGPELHRWHHSVEATESNTNFGNNLIIWDALFSTRLLPEGREVDALGNGDPNYPQDFLGSIRRPFE